MLLVSFLALNEKFFCSSNFFCILTFAIFVWKVLFLLLRKDNNKFWHLSSSHLGLCSTLSREEKNAGPRVGQPNQPPWGNFYLLQSCLRYLCLLFLGCLFLSKYLSHFAVLQVKHWMDPALIPYGWGLFSEGEEVGQIE